MEFDPIEPASGVAPDSVYLEGRPGMSTYLTPGSNGEKEHIHEAQYYDAMGNVRASPGRPP